MHSPITSPESSHLCRICAQPVPLDPRYPRAVCPSCAQRVVDENGRPLRFFNASLSGGLIGVYADTGEERSDPLCYIDGVRCRADEAHMGGVVVSVYLE